MRYLFRRFQRLLVVLTAVTFFTFLLVNVLPGDVAYEMAGMDSSEREVQEIRQELGLDRTCCSATSNGSSGVFTGDWGRSFLSQERRLGGDDRPLPRLVRADAAGAVHRADAGDADGADLGLPAQRAGRTGSSGSIAFASVSMPSFMSAILLIFFFSLHLGWLPATGYEPLSEGLWANLRPMILPALQPRAGGVDDPHADAAGRDDRGAAGELHRPRPRQGHVEHAHPAGPCAAALVLLHDHAARPPGRAALGGSIIIEQIFGIPGVGRLLIHAVYTRDFIDDPGLRDLLRLAFVTANFLVDIAYAWLDPRVRGRSAPMADISSPTGAHAIADTHEGDDRTPSPSPSTAGRTGWGCISGSRWSG